MKLEEKQDLYVPYIHMYNTHKEEYAMLYITDEDGYYNIIPEKIKNVSTKYISNYINTMKNPTKLEDTIIYILKDVLKRRRIEKIKSIKNNTKI